MTLEHDPRLHAPSFIWGLLFLVAAGLGAGEALGADIPWQSAGWWAPSVLIALGALGLALDRAQHRKRRRTRTSKKA